MHNSKKVIPNSGDVILVTGSNGLIASAVIEHLNMLSIPVLRGVRNSPNSDQDFQVNDLNVHGIETPKNEKARSKILVGNRFNAYHLTGFKYIHYRLALFYFLQVILKLVKETPLKVKKTE